MAGVSTRTATLVDGTLLFNSELLALNCDESKLYLCNCDIVLL